MTDEPPFDLPPAEGQMPAGWWILPALVVNLLLLALLLPLALTTLAGWLRSLSARHLQ